MFRTIFTARLLVPLVVTLYGLFLLGMRLLTLENPDMEMNVSLVVLTGAVAAGTWVMDIC